VSGWTDFAAVVGAATAALLGLLFVAVSIRVETIAKSAELRNRSAQTLSLLLTGLLAAVLLAVPDQRKWALGIEYVVLAVVVAGVALTLDRRAGSRSGSTLGRSLDAINFDDRQLLTAARNRGDPDPRTRGRALLPRPGADRGVGRRSRECMAHSCQARRLSRAKPSGDSVA
jgi:hypothetical protein